MLASHNIPQNLIEQELPYMAYICRDKLIVRPDHFPI